MKHRATALLLLMVPISLLIGIGAGSVSLSPSAVWQGLLHGDAPAAMIVRHLRLPRALLAFLVGGSLGVTGAALQALVRNPLAEPYLLGLSGGAGLGAVLAIAVEATGVWTVPLAGFLGALGTMALVYRLSVVVGRRLDPRVLLLAGVVVSSFTVAVMGAIMALSPAEQLRGAFLWLLGGFGSASWTSLGVFAAYAIAPIVLLFASARSLDLIALGDETAQHLGANAETIKRVVYLTTSLLTAAGVAVSGIIGFVGLVVPHAVRLVWSPLHRGLLPIAFILGGSFLVLADVLARTLARPVELPVGVVTALVGVPLFAMLLRRSLA